MVCLNRRLRHQNLRERGLSVILCLIIPLRDQKRRTLKRLVCRLCFYFRCCFCLHLHHQKKKILKRLAQSRRLHHRLRLCCCCLRLYHQRKKRILENPTSEIVEEVEIMVVHASFCQQIIHSRKRGSSKLCCGGGGGRYGGGCGEGSHGSCSKGGCGGGCGSEMVVAAEKAEAAEKADMEKNKPAAEIAERRMQKRTHKRIQKRMQKLSRGLRGCRSLHVW